MTLLTISLFVPRTDQIGLLVDRVRSAAERGARLVEWRIDPIGAEDGALAAVSRLVGESPLPSIVTCRPEREGGDYTGDEVSRCELLERIVSSERPPRYLDVEWDALLRVDGPIAGVLATLRRQPEATKTSIIVSSHDFDGRPADLIQRVEGMALCHDAAVIKLAWRARSLRDNLEAFELLATRPTPMIALCMGPFGFMSRVLAAKFGGFLTFASDGEDETAPGQPTIDELMDVYHFPEIGPATEVYGVIGWPVAQSRGPDVHNAGFRAVGHDGVYLRMPVSPEFEPFKATVLSMIDTAGLHFRGASVTLPHKGNLVRLVQETGGTVDALSAIVGAANTLRIDDAGQLEARNTDAPAAVEVLCDTMGIEPGGLAGVRVAMLGAGGVARAITGALARHGAEVVVINRSPEKAEALAAELRGHTRESGEPLAVTAGSESASPFAVIINGTSIGMAGTDAAELSPLSLLGDGFALDPSMTVFDTVYTPSETPLIKAAESTGCRTVTGDRMFVRQAELQFEWWTGQRAPEGVFG